MRATVLDDLIAIVLACPDRIIASRFCHSGFMNATALSEKDLIEPWLVQLKRVRQRMATEGYGTEAGRLGGFIAEDVRIVFKKPTDPPPPTDRLAAVPSEEWESFLARKRAEEGGADTLLAEVFSLSAQAAAPGEWGVAVEPTERRFGDRLRDLIQGEHFSGTEEATGAALDTADAIDRDAAEWAAATATTVANAERTLLRQKVEQLVEELRFTRIQYAGDFDVRVASVDVEPFLERLAGIFSGGSVGAADTQSSA